MANLNERVKQFTIDLFRIGAIKFGEFKTKVGLMTPIYIDLRMIVSYPSLLNDLSGLIVDRLPKIEEFDAVCGVPYTALPIATVVSLKTNIPMVMRRKEAKNYGTKKLIEGNFRVGQSCVLIEDVVTSGGSVLETAEDLRGAGLRCTDAMVLMDRQQGGASHLRENGIQMHALLNMRQLLEYLFEAHLIDEVTVRKVDDYLKTTQVDLGPQVNRLKMPFSAREKIAENPTTRQLFRIMEKKKSMLCLAADLPKAADILNLAETVGPSICLFKTHIDIIEDFSKTFVETLQKIAVRHNFLLFEDRKFADIGKTVQLQYTKGPFEISSWASLITCHSLTGSGVLEAIHKSTKECGVFLLAEISCKKSLINESYTNDTIKLAREFPDLITGIVCQSPLFLDKPDLIQLTPGVQLAANSDSLDQQYNSPGMVVREKGCDVAVVGRGITASKNPAEMAEKYRRLLWEAYCERIE